jgi:hypothetical protein
VIRLATEQRCGYIIVRKDSTLTVLAKECDERTANQNHKKNCTKKLKSSHEGWLIERKYEWFNSMYLGENVSTNVLRFCEIREKVGKEEKYKCAWLFSKKLSAATCELAVRQARARWEEEDIFNSLKNRGFNFKLTLRKMLGIWTEAKALGVGSVEMPIILRKVSLNMITLEIHVHASIGKDLPCLLLEFLSFFVFLRQLKIEAIYLKLPCPRNSKGNYFIDLLKKFFRKDACLKEFSFGTILSSSPSYSMKLIKIAA